MNKIKFALSFLFLPILAFSQVSITEVMYDPPEGKDLGREWIEIINDSGTEISISDFRLHEAKVNHRLIPVTEDVLKEGQVAVIVQDPQAFLQDNPQYRGIMFTSVFNLRQRGGKGEKLSIYSKTEDREVSSVTYIPDPRSSGTGGSIHFTSEGQVSAPATPGIIATNPFEDTELSETDLEAVLEEEKQEIPDPKSPDIQINGAVLAGVEFSASIQEGPRNILWNFGDGTVSKGTTISHTYENPGVYRLMIGYGSEVVTKIITVTEPLIEILIEEDLVYIDNGNAFAIQIDKWQVISSEGTFVFPKLSSIEGKTRVPISVISTSSPYFILKSPNGVLISRYGIGSEAINNSEIKEVNTVLREPRLLPWFIALIVLILVALMPIILESYYDRKK